MLDDFLRQSSIYQDILEEGRAEGRVEGERKGRTEGRIEGSILTSQETLLALFDERFPRLNKVAQKLLPVIKKLEVLQRLTIEIAVAKDEKEARERLLEAAIQDE